MNENPDAEALAITSLIEARTDPFVLIDDHYRIVAANTRYASLYGLRPGQLTGFKCHEVSHHRSTPCHHHGEACPLRTVMDTGKATEVTHVHFGCGDQQQLVRIKGYPLEFRGRRLLGESIEPLKKAETGEGAAPASKAGMVGASRAFLSTLEKLGRAARFDVPVLLLGETGVGKELAARFVHDHSARRDRPYVTVDCTTLPEALAESELFGHARGAYTGAMGTRAGLFEQAHGGTVFLDEVGELSLAVQAKLLRVLETGELRRLGEGSPKRVDVRVICATHRDLLADVSAGRMRMDLFYRVAGVDVTLPPLRERREDIPLLAEHFLAQFRERSGEPLYLAPDAIDWLREQDFPGNLRELRQVVTRAAAQCGDGLVSAGVLRAQCTRVPAPSQRLAQPSIDATTAALAVVERASRVDDASIDRALQRHDQNRALAAQELGVTERTVYRWLQRQRRTSRHAAGSSAATAE
jgi:transcriptional regulator with GAF, ATPase, and Fis domain